MREPRKLLFTLSIVQKWTHSTWIATTAKVGKINQVQGSEVSEVLSFSSGKRNQDKYGYGLWKRDLNEGITRGLRELNPVSIQILEIQVDH